MLRAFFFLSCSSLLIGCSTLKHLMVGGAAATAAYAGAQLFNPVGAAALAATSATATDYVLTKAMSKPTEIVAGCPDQITSGWGLLGQRIETAGLWVGLFFLITALVPLILGYLLPGPLERKARKRRR